MLSATPGCSEHSFITRNPLKVTALTSARTAIALMSGLEPAPNTLLEANEAEPTEPTNCIFVVEEDRLLGILTEGDVVKLCAQGQSLDVPISEVMTQPAIILEESACQDILSAITLLQLHKVQQVPVLDAQGRLVGILNQAALNRSELKTEHICSERNFFETIFEVVLGGYWDWDIENQQEYLSPRFKQIFGYEEEELPNEPGTWKSIILAEDLSKILDGFDRHFQSRGTVPFRCEARYRHKNGSVVWVLCSGTVVKWDAAGNPLRMVGCHMDITEHKQTEQTLASYAREVEDLYNHAPCGYHSLDSKGKLININDTLLGWLGYSREEAIGKPFTEFVPAEKVLLFQAYFLEFKRSGRVKDLDFEIVCKDGTLLPVFLNSIAVEDSYGRFLHSRATLFDARDRKRAEETARINQERLELALEGSGDGLWDWNTAAGEVYFSPRWLEMLGYRTGELSPKIESWLLLVHPEDRLHVTATIESYLQGSCVPHAFEYRMQHRTAGWRWIANFGKVVARDWADQPLRIVGIHRDITEQKVAEQHIKRTSAQLEATNLEAAVLFLFSLSRLTRSAPPYWRLCERSQKTASASHRLSGF